MTGETLSLNTAVRSTYSTYTAQKKRTSPGSVKMLSCTYTAIAVTDRGLGDFKGWPARLNPYLSFSTVI